AELLKNAVDYVRDGLTVHYVKVLKYRADRGDLLIVDGVGWKPGVVGTQSLPVGLASPPGRAWQLCEPVLISDLRASKEYEYSPLLKEHNIITLINVPIVAERETWGVLEADSRTPGAVDEYDAQFLHVFARILGEAIQRTAIDEEREKWVQALAHAAQERE